MHSIYQGKVYDDCHQMAGTIAQKSMHSLADKVTPLGQALG